MKKENAYEKITQRIIELLDKGDVPWKKPWGCDEWPCNLKTKREYRGINTILLHYSGFSSRYWATFKQISELDGKVNKGEKGTKIYFFSIILKNDEKNADKKVSIPVLKEFTVFNFDQISGIEAPIEDKKVKTSINEKIQACEEVVKNFVSKPKILDGSTAAFYRPSEDMIAIPNIKAFDTSEHYYATLFHELIHSTGHISRLNRDGVVNQIKFGSHDYSKEELVAEFGSAFLCARTEIDNLEIVGNSAAYIASWKKKLSDNPKWIVSACSSAQKASDYILGIEFENTLK